MLTLTHPWALLLLILPVIFWYLPKHFTQAKALRFSHFERFLKVTGITPSKGALVLSPMLWQRVLITLTYLSLTLACTKPVLMGEPVTFEKSGRELMVAVDLSGSMEARDFVDLDGIKVRRVDGVKILLSTFLKQREGDRVGLIAFGDDAYLQAPFTEDFNTLNQLLNEMDVGMAGSGTALGDAIGVAANHFQHSDSKSKVLILMTDGRDTTSQYPPIDAAHFAGQNGITIYPIAIGDPSNVGEDSIDITMLERIAEYTDGQVFEAIDGEGLLEVYETLNSLEESIFDSYTVRPKHELYYVPLLMSLILNLVSLLVVARHNNAEVR